jgi:CheY-like chemotaxis protein
MKKKILLVDDEPISHFINIKAIEMAGIDSDIKTVSNGSEALEYLEEKAAAPDVIFLDIDMPVMDGFGFLRSFKEMEIENKDRVKIIILTSSFNHEDVEKAMSFGIETFLAKPLTRIDLSNIVF